jgi:hypothetical protein
MWRTASWIGAEGLALGVEHAGDVGGRVIDPQPAQHVDHAVHRTGRVAFGAAQVREGVIGAVQVAGTIDEQQGVLHRGRKGVNMVGAIRDSGHYRRIR